MSRLPLRAFALVSIIAAVWFAPTVASRAARVHPSQHFVGIVNGNHANAVVYVACPGPEWPGRTGPPTGSQYLATILLDSGGGFTGSAGTSIVATITQDPSVAIELRQYGVARPIPTKLAVPCSGPGTVSFRPTPESSDASADTVNVTFENIAV